MNTGLSFEPRPVILDTDLGGDIDDLGALAVPLNLKRAGRCLELGCRERGFRTGRALARLAPRHPLRIGYEDFFRRPPWWVKGGPWTEIQPWSIWDQITVLRAVLARGTPGLVEHEGWRCVVDEDGGNRWVPDSTSLHRRLALSPDWTPERFASEIVEPWMLRGNDRGSGRP